MTKRYNDPRCIMTLAEIEAEMASEFLEKYPTLKDFETAHPVCQLTHTGKWGFEHYIVGEGDIDMRSCVYPNREYAEKVRSTTYGRGVGGKRGTV